MQFRGERLRRTGISFHTFETGGSRGVVEKFSRKRRYWEKPSSNKRFLFRNIRRRTDNRLNRTVKKSIDSCQTVQNVVYWNTSSRIRMSRFSFYDILNETEKPLENRLRQRTVDTRHVCCSDFPNGTLPKAGEPILFPVAGRPSIAIDRSTQAVRDLKSYLFSMCVQIFRQFSIIRGESLKIARCFWGIFHVFNVNVRLE